MVAVTIQLPSAMAVTVVPLMLQVLELVVKVTAPVPLPPVIDIVVEAPKPIGFVANTTVMVAWFPCWTVKVPDIDADSYTASAALVAVIVQEPVPVGATLLPVIVQLPLFDVNVTAPVPDPPLTETVCDGPPNVSGFKKRLDNGFCGSLLTVMSSVTCGAAL